MPEVSEVARVQQEHRFGCMAATAAMILGIGYNEAAAMLTDNTDVLHSQGLGWFVLDSRLVDRGYAIARKYKITQPGNREREVWPCDPWADLHWCEVITVAGTAHAVVMLADGTVIDPDTPEPKRLDDYAKVNFVAAVVPVSARNEHVA